MYSQKYEIHLQRVQLLQKRFDSTPSIRPVFGPINSRFGWRNHPIKKGKRFHKGIDIKTWYGAPIQATADGIVIFSKWNKHGFGYTVVIDHGYGIKTLYAHCSRLLVKRKDFVTKGQVIAQVGSTGFSTGPHLHYEVKKWRKSLNPIAFLDLDIFTAQQRIW